jgi:hypothetical protein
MFERHYAGDLSSENFKDALSAFEGRLVACAVPDMQDLNTLRFLANVVENAVWTKHDFAQRTS